MRLLRMKFHANTAIVAITLEAISETSVVPPGEMCARTYMIISFRPSPAIATAAKMASWTWTRRYVFRNVYRRFRKS
jgi:hypothetical protein